MLLNDKLCEKCTSYETMGNSYGGIDETSY